MIYTCDNDGIYQYIVDSGVNRRVIELEERLQNVAPNIREGWIAYTYITGHTVNITDDRHFEFGMLYENRDAAAEGYSVWLVQWHPSKAWLFARSDLGWYVNVLNVDGSVHRELVSCNRQKSCYGWMPNRN